MTKRICSVVWIFCFLFFSCKTAPPADGDPPQTPAAGEIIPPAELEPPEQTEPPEVPGEPVPADEVSVFLPSEETFPALTVPLAEPSLDFPEADFPPSSPRERAFTALPPD
ncbi:MAG: hypothetical protein LBT95_05540, partial [Treponema sp.]|nr:hypothetical protein [Treponema sp.]